MAIPTINAGARRYLIQATTQNNPGWPLVELGPGGTTQQVSTMVIQFTPQAGWVGAFVVMARAMGTAADEVDVPFVPVPYRVGSLEDVAQVSAGEFGWPWAWDATMNNGAGGVPPITGNALIQVPCTGQSICLVVTRDAGECYVTPWGVQGSSAL